MLPDSVAGVDDVEAVEAVPPSLLVGLAAISLPEELPVWLGNELAPAAVAGFAPTAGLLGLLPQAVEEPAPRAGACEADVVELICGDEDWPGAAGVDVAEVVEAVEGAPGAADPDGAAPGVEGDGGIVLYRTGWPGAAGREDEELVELVCGVLEPLSN